MPQLFATLKKLCPISCLKSSDKTAQKVEQVATQSNNIRRQVNASLPQPLQNCKHVIAMLTPELLQTIKGIFSELFCIREEIQDFFSERIDIHASIA